jgi:biopolymer transport protein ExbD
MKFPRNARIFRGQLDAAPFAAVFFLLVIFVMLSTQLYTPGVALSLPVADDLPGTDRPTVAVAVDAAGRMYFENQSLSESSLTKRLRKAVADSSEPLTLIVQLDRAASMDMLIRLTAVARSAGITNNWLAILPRPLSSSPFRSAQ